MSCRQKGKQVNAPILDADLEQELLACRLVTEIRKNPDQVYITLSGEGVIKFVEAMQSSMRNNNAVTKFIPSGNTIIAVTDDSIISKKELVNDLGMNMNHILTLQKQGRLTPIKFGGRVYYKRDEIEKLNQPFYESAKI